MTKANLFIVLLILGCLGVYNTALSQEKELPVEGYKNFAYNFHLSTGVMGLFNNYEPDSTVYWHSGLGHHTLGIGVGLIFDRFDLEISFRTIYSYKRFKKLFSDGLMTSYYLSGGYNLFPKWKKHRWDVRFGLGINPGLPIYNGRGGYSEQAVRLQFTNRIETQYAYRVLNKNPRMHFNPALRLGVMWTYVKSFIAPKYGIEFYSKIPVNFYASIVLHFGGKERNKRNPGLDHMLLEF